MHPCMEQCHVGPVVKAYREHIWGENRSWDPLHEHLASSWPKNNTRIHDLWSHFVWFPWLFVFAGMARENLALFLV